MVPSRGLKELDRHQRCLGSEDGISPVSPDLANTIHAFPTVRNEAAWPRIDCHCQNRAHGLLYMRASRRGRTITTISLVAEQSWFSLAVGSIPCIPQAFASIGPKGQKIAGSGHPTRQSMNCVGTRPLVCTQELPASGLPLVRLTRCYTTAIGHGPT